VYSSFNEWIRPTVSERWVSSPEILEKTSRNKSIKHLFSSEDWERILIIEERISWFVLSSEVDIVGSRMLSIFKESWYEFSESWSKDSKMWKIESLCSLSCIKDIWELESLFLKLFIDVDKLLIIDSKGCYSLIEIREETKLVIWEVVSENCFGNWLFSTLAFESKLWSFVFSFLVVESSV
jgi:hypothetical protein